MSGKRPFRVKKAANRSGANDWCEGADFDRSGAVDWADALVLFGNWLTGG